MKTALPIPENARAIATEILECAESLHNGALTCPGMFPEEYVIPGRGLIRTTDTEETNN